MSAPAAPPPVALMQLISGKWVAQAVSVAARFRVADHLAAGPKTAAELAALTGTHAPSLFRVLRALAGVGVFTLDGDRFALTPVGEFLRSDVPGNLRAVATYCCDPWSWQAWGDLARCVRDGEPSFDRLFGEPVFDYLGKHPAEGATFNEGMVGFSRQFAAAIVKGYDFTRFGTIVDVGGGHGGLLAAILKKSPGVRGVVFDSPGVVAGAGPVLAEAGVADRCRAEGGDFFEAVPPGGDLYLLKHIVHDWNDAKATAILKSCRAAIPPAGTLLLAELVLTHGPESALGRLLDLEMLVICGGKERTEAEYRDLLAGAGFRLTRVVPTEGPVSLVEAVPV